MHTIYTVVRSKRTTAAAGYGLTVLNTFLAALLEWRERGKLRARLCDLSDRELLDIGIARGEVDYVASNRSIDPRGAV